MKDNQLQAITSALMDENYPVALELLRDAVGESDSPDIRVVVNNLEIVETFLEESDYESADRELRVVSAYNNLATVRELHDLRVAVEKIATKF